MTPKTSGMASSTTPASRWSYAAWICGAILVLAIFLGMGATIWRMDQTYNLADSDIASPEDYQAMVDTSLHWARTGLFIGIPAALLYMISLVMLQRSRNRDEWD